MVAKELCLKFRQAINSLSICEIQLLKFGGVTSSYATILFVSESFQGIDLKNRLQLVYKALDTYDYSLRRSVDLTLILLTPTERSEWEDFSKYDPDYSKLGDSDDKAAKEISPE